MNLSNKNNQTNNTQKQTNTKQETLFKFNQPNSNNNDIDDSSDVEIVDVSDDDDKTKTGQQIKTEKVNTDEIQHQNFDNIFTNDDDLYDRAHKLSNLIVSSLKSNPYDPNITKLKDERRKVWQEIESMESKIQGFIPPEQDTKSSFTINGIPQIPINENENENENSASQSTAGIVPIRKDKYNQPAYDEDDCIFELFPEDQKCKNAEIEALITEINKNIFHHDKFRGCQAAAIESALTRHDVFVIMPTGGGKSLIYQLAGFIDNKLTVVISPLISLIRDQVESLQKLNIKAACLLGEANLQDVSDTFELIKKGELLFLFITPEKLDVSSNLRNFLLDIHERKQITRFVVDEAHCVSQWGHDFRPSYAKLDAIRRDFAGIPIIALTATATSSVKRDIINELNIPDCEKFQTSFNRPNLIYEVRPKGSKEDSYQTILDFINDRNLNNKCGLIFCMSTHDTEELSNWLNENGLNTRFYHAQMRNQNDRHEVQRFWMSNQVDIIVATLAFGMGIDKPDVRFVIHHTMPKSIEAYYQETGRAGRDGLRSYCLLLYSKEDRSRVQSLISYDRDKGESKADQRLQIEYGLLDRISQFCMNKRVCRRVQVLNYFGEDFSEDRCKETCDNCINRELGLSQFRTEDESKVAKSLAKIVMRIYSKRKDISPYPTPRYITAVFNGQKTNDISKYGDYLFPEFEEGKEQYKGKEDMLSEILMLLVRHQILKYKIKLLAHGAFQYLVPGPNFSLYFDAKKVSNNEIEINDKKVDFPQFLIDIEIPIRPDGMNDKDIELYHNIIDKRDKLAFQYNMNNPSSILKASTLKLMVLKKPTNLDALLVDGEINENDRNKLKIYGREFINVITDFLTNKSPNSLKYKIEKKIRLSPNSSPNKSDQNRSPQLRFNSSSSNSYEYHIPVHNNNIQSNQLNETKSFNQNDNNNYIRSNSNFNSINIQSNDDFNSINIQSNGNYYNMNNQNLNSISINNNDNKNYNSISINNNDNQNMQANNNQDNDVEIEDYTFLDDEEGSKQKNDFIEQQKKIWESIKHEKPQPIPQNNQNTLPAPSRQEVVDLTLDDSDDDDNPPSTPVLSQQQQSFFSRLKKSNKG